MYTVLLLLAFTVIVRSNETNVTEKPLIQLPLAARDEVLNAIFKCCSPQDAADMIYIIREGGIRMDREFQKCTYCMYKEAGYINDDGRVKIYRASSLFPDSDEMLKILKQCDANNYGSTPEETTFKAFECYQDKVLFRVAL